VVLLQSSIKVWDWTVKLFLAQLDERENERITGGFAGVDQYLALRIAWAVAVTHAKPLIVQAGKEPCQQESKPVQGWTI
jgi:hypothetical protein